MKQEIFQCVKKYSKRLVELHIKSYRRFSNFEEIHDAILISSCLLTQDLERTLEKLKLKLIDVQSDFILKEKGKFMLREVKQNFQNYQRWHRESFSYSVSRTHVSRHSVE